MFADPQTVTINSVGKTLNRVSSDGTRSVYKSADGIWTLTVSHTPTGKGRIRTQIRLDQRTIVPDPLTAVNDYETLTNYHVIDRPEAGYTSTQVAQQVAGLNAWLDATAVGKLCGMES